MPRSRSSARAALVSLSLLAAAAGLSACVGSTRAADVPGKGAPIGDQLSAQRSCAERASEATIGPVKADSKLDSLWTGYMSTNKGWTGGDSVFAYDIPSLGRLWTFADAYVGGLETGGQRKSGIHHSMFVVQSPTGAFRVRWREYGNPTLVGPANGPVLDLSLSGAPGAREFQELFTVRRRFGEESIETEPTGTVLATFALPSLDLIASKAVGGDPHSVVWGSYVSRFGGYSYIYGAAALGFDKHAFVARVRGADLSRPWSYWDGHGWTGNASAARPFGTGVEQEYSVTLVDGVYVRVTSYERTPFSPDADVSFGCSPVGPFINHHHFLVSLAVGPVGVSMWHDPQVYVYDVVAQPALQAPRGDIVLSYDQNSLDFLSVLAHAYIYRPGYLDLPIHVPAR
jgi:hypothetical protein